MQAGWENNVHERDKDVATFVAENTFLFKLVARTAKFVCYFDTSTRCLHANRLLILALKTQMFFLYGIVSVFVARNAHYWIGPA